MSDLSVLCVGDRVKYNGRDGVTDAVVVKVHYDDNPPYYTIKMQGNPTER